MCQPLFTVDGGNARRNPAVMIEAFVASLLRATASSRFERGALEWTC